MEVNEKKKVKIAYCTPSLYIPGGVERVLTTKANYLAEKLDYDIYIILTDGKDKEPYYPLSPKIHLINLDINFEVLWGKPILKKGLIYLKKQRQYKKALKDVLMQIRPDITISLLRREVNFITTIHDGSLKFGELHVNRLNYRNFEKGDSNFVKEIFARFWMNSLIRNLKKLDQFVVLSEEDKGNWKELDNVRVVSNPLPFDSEMKSTTEAKSVIAVGRYAYQKGFDLLLKAWVRVAERHPDWQLKIYGGADRSEYQRLADELGISGSCTLNAAVTDITEKYCESSIFVLSSRFEGFGMVLIEAMNCGLPAVSFQCPCGPKDIVHDGVDGFLVETGDTEGLAEKICYLIEHPEKRVEMGHRAIENSGRFKLENIAAQWDSLFRSALKR